MHSSLRPLHKLWSVEHGLPATMLKAIRRVQLWKTLGTTDKAKQSLLLGRLLIGRQMYQPMC